MRDTKEGKVSDSVVTRTPKPAESANDGETIQGMRNGRRRVVWKAFWCSVICDMFMVWLYGIWYVIEDE